MQEQEGCSKMTVYKEFVKKLKDGIKQKGCTLKKVAEYAKIDVSYLSKIISGKRNPPHDETTIKRIAKFLDIEEDELLLSAGRIPSKYLQFFSSEEILSCFKQYLFKGNFYKKEVKQQRQKKLTVVEEKDKTQKISMPEELL